MDDRITVFDNHECGLHIRAFRFEDFTLVDGNDSQFDFNLWFVALPGIDSWLCTSITIGLEADIDEALPNFHPDLEIAGKTAVFVGMSWKLLTEQCPHCVAEEQRDRVHAISDQIWKDIQDSTPEELIRFRSEGEFEAMQEQLIQVGGPHISLN